MINSIPLIGRLANSGGFGRDASSGWMIVGTIPAHLVEVYPVAVTPA